MKYNFIKILMTYILIYNIRGVLKYLFFEFYFTYIIMYSSF